MFADETSLIAVSSARYLLCKSAARFVDVLGHFSFSRRGFDPALYTSVGGAMLACWATTPVFWLDPEYRQEVRW
jgi:hypothetical protein